MTAEKVSAKNAFQTSKIDCAYVVKVCRGTNGCPNTVFQGTEIVDGIENVLKKSEFDAFIQSRIQGSLKPHHLFKVTIACCPNACSQPQIADFGIVLAGPVMISEKPCAQCGECVRTCLENAIDLNPIQGPEIIADRCLHCGQCAGVCPTSTIAKKAIGFRVMIGGKLGRHPRFATEIPGILSQTQVFLVLDKCLALLMENHSRVKRFADLFAIFNEKCLLEMLTLTDPGLR